MEQLSPLDAQFLNVEDTTTTGHVGALVVLDDRTADDRPLDLEAVRRSVEARLSRVPRFRQKLRRPPYGIGLPLWVDDEQFDPEFHLRELGLPSPGGDGELADQVARLHARPLDRARPLWELYVISGLDDGRCAVYLKVHHAAIDGVSGVDLLSALLDDVAEPPDEAPDEWVPRPPPADVVLVPQVALASARTYAEAVTRLPGSLPYLTRLPGATNVPGVARLAAAASSVGEVVAGLTRPRPTGRRLFAPPTPFSGPVTPHRRIAVGSLPLDRVQVVRRRLGLSVNDVVLALTTSALRRWLLDRDALPMLPLLAGVPVSVRAAPSASGPATDPGSGGNEVSVMSVRLPTDVAGARERAAYLREEVTVAKGEFDAVPASILRDMSGVLPTRLSGLASRALFRLVATAGQPVNLCVSNVPGPQRPLWLAGARVRAIHPLSAVSALTGGLNVTVLSYDGSLDVGLVACREMVPDVARLVGYLEDALVELEGLEALEGLDGSGTGS